jgi:hypothetical protein
MAEAPRYRDGHAVVAAVRVHEAKLGRPPTSPEIAQLLGWHVDQASVVTRALSELGILKALQSPYELRYEVRDHLALEKLEDDAQGSGFASELESFAQAKEAEQERLASFFQSGEAEKSRERKAEELDSAFRDFRRGKKPFNPFGEPES